MLWVNMIMDSLASLALATEPPDPRILSIPPFSQGAPLAAAAATPATPLPLPLHRPRQLLLLPAPPAAAAALGPFFSRRVTPCAAPPMMYRCTADGVPPMM